MAMVIQRMDGGRKRRRRYEPCRVCGDPRPTSRASASIGITCQKCRRVQRAERDQYRVLESAGAATSRAFNTGKTTHQQGLGHQHQVAVAELKRNHVDGSPCDWCGRPMWLTPTENYDGQKLQGDHRVARSLGGLLTDRLLHGECNRQRGNGANDHLAWINQSRCVATELDSRNAS